MPTRWHPLKIVLDSNAFIFGLRLPRSVNGKLLTWLQVRTVVYDDVVVLIPAMVETEVRRNLMLLAPELTRRFYHLIRDLSAQKFYMNPPEELLLKYHHLGMSIEDGYIAAFAEWQDAEYLISENRHFLKELRADAFKVLDAAGFMKRTATLFED